MTAQAATAPREEDRAAARAVLGLTLGVGAVAAAASALIGDSMILVALPVLALAASLVRRSSRAAGFSAAAVWLVFLPRSEGDALLVPLAMAAACLAIGIGPGRISEWFGDRRDGAERDTEDAWIEDL